MEKIDIFLVTYNMPQMVEAIIDRVYAHTETPFNLIVVDNNSDREVVDLLNRLRREKNNLTVIRNFKNVFACPATNQALRLCRNRYAFYLCSRECFVLEQGWERDCIEFMEAFPKVGIAGYVIKSPQYYNGKTYYEMPFFEKFRNREFAIKNPERPFAHVQGGFYVIRMGMVKEIDYFNEALEHNYMDVEFSYYVESCGWELGDIPSVISLHNTTRPNIKGYDPSIKVYHPLTMERAMEFEKLRDEHKARILRGGGPRVL